jgi:hypothetical protein
MTRSKKRKMYNIYISKSDFEVMNFDDKKELLMKTYPLLVIDDINDDEFDVFFEVNEEE